MQIKITKQIVGTAETLLYKIYLFNDDKNFPHKKVSSATALNHLNIRKVLFYTISNLLADKCKIQRIFGGASTHPFIFNVKSVWYSCIGWKLPSTVSSCISWIYWHPEITRAGKELTEKMQMNFRGFDIDSTDDGCCSPFIQKILKRWLHHIRMKRGFSALPKQDLENVENESHIISF